MSESVAWAAGLFEGEGCVFAKPDKGRIRLVTSLDSCDLDVLARFHIIVGVGKLYGPYHHSNGTKPYWKWKATGRDDVRRVRQLFAEYLGERRLVAFAEACDTFDSQPPYKKRGPKKVAA